MNRKKSTIIIIVAAIFFLASVFLFISNRRGVEDDDSDLLGRTYTNEILGYTMKYPSAWSVEDARNLPYFHSAIENNLDLQTEIDLSAYRAVSAVNLIGVSPLTYIDGVINYNIEKHTYRNTNNLLPRQWYEIAVLIEAYDAQKISEAEFIRTSNRIIERGGYIEEEENIFDPWMSRGEEKSIGSKDIVIATRVGGNRYDGYQYYITKVGDYIFVFNFGYGGPIIPREMWGRSDTHVKEMIRSLNIL